MSSEYNDKCKAYLDLYYEIKEKTAQLQEIKSDIISAFKEGYDFSGFGLKIYKRKDFNTDVAKQYYIKKHKALPFKIIPEHKEVDVDLIKSTCGGNKIYDPLAIFQNRGKKYVSQT